MRQLGRHVTEDDIVLLRAGSGYLHLGIRLGRGYDTMCCNPIDAAPHVRAWTGDDAGRVARKKARYFCLECVVVSERPWRIIRRITGWE